MASENGPQPKKRKALWIIALILVVAAGLRVGFANQKSLVLDEFHSYFHATRPSIDSFFETLKLDNHPPLSFAIIAGSRSLFGESEFALRLPAIVYGLIELMLVLRLAGLLGLKRGRAFAVALLAASSLHLDFSTQVRMYALHALAVTGLIEGILSTLLSPPDRSTRKARVRVGLWLTVGMMNHYFFVQYAFWIAAAGLVATRCDWKQLRAFVAPTAIAALLCLPWYATGFREQLGHELPPGGANIGLKDLGEAFVHMFFLNVRLGGESLRLIYIASGVVAFCAAAYGLFKLVRCRGTNEDRAAPILIGAVAFWVPLATTVTAMLFARAGFTWHYVLPSAAAMALLAAHTTEFSKWGRVVLGFVVASALSLSVLNARSSGTENFRGAIQSVIDRLEPNDAVVSVEWQPPLFPQAQPWNYYAPRSRYEEEPPTPLSISRGFSVDKPMQLVQHERVWVLSSRLPNEALLLRLLRENFETVSIERFGFQPTVLLFVRR